MDQEMVLTTMKIGRKYTLKELAMIFYNEDFTGRTRQLGGLKNSLTKLRKWKQIIVEPNGQELYYIKVGE